MSLARCDKARAIGSIGILYTSTYLQSLGQMGPLTCWEVLHKGGTMLQEGASKDCLMYPSRQEGNRGLRSCMRPSVNSLVGDFFQLEVLSYE